jgi:hypothetical protein
MISVVSMIPVIHSIDLPTMLLFLPWWPLVT